MGKRKSKVLNKLDSAVLSKLEGMFGGRQNVINSSSNKPIKVEKSKKKRVFKLKPMPTNKNNIVLNKDDHKNKNENKDINEEIQIPKKIILKENVTKVKKNEENKNVVDDKILNKLIELNLSLLNNEIEIIKNRKYNNFWKNSIMILASITGIICYKYYF